MFTSGSKGKGSSKASGSQVTRQMHGNLEQNEVSAFIKCKHLKHVAQKQLIDPRAHMVLIAQRWNKIVKDLQNLLHTKEEKNLKNMQG
jgi:hypothetical protein